MKKLFCQECKISISYVPGLYNCPKCHSKYYYECSGCNKIFKGRSSIYRHIRRMHAKLRHSCKNCNRLFSFYGDMNEHFKSCGKEPQYECNICYFKTRYKYNLACHMHKLHNENRRSFACGNCGIEYKTSKSLQRHMLITCK
jgi:KRAB domain-containing zinc finger protein